jgi:hypothetical protein
MEKGAYNIVEQVANYEPYPTTMSVVAFLRRTWREEPLPAREVTVTGLDTLLAGVPEAERARVSRFIRETLQDVAGEMARQRDTVQFVLRGQIDKGEFFEVRQPDGQYVNLSAIFGSRLRQRANDWLVAAFWV